MVDIKDWQILNRVKKGQYFSLLTELSCKSGIYQERGPKGPDF